MKIARYTIIKDTIQELLKNKKTITRAQIKEESGIEDPEKEIIDLVKNGTIMEICPDDIRWV